MVTPRGIRAQAGNTPQRSSRHASKAKLAWGTEKGTWQFFTALHRLPAGPTTCRPFHGAKLIVYWEGFTSGCKTSHTAHILQELALFWVAFHRVLHSLHTISTDICPRSCSTSNWGIASKRRGPPLICHLSARLRSSVARCIGIAIRPVYRYCTRSPARSVLHCTQPRQLRICPESSLQIDPNQIARYILLHRIS